LKTDWEEEALIPGEFVVSTLLRCIKENQKRRLFNTQKVSGK